MLSKHRVILIGAVASPAFLTSCVAPATVYSPTLESRDIQSCVAIFETTEEELGLTRGADVATGQMNYANWLEGMLGDSDDPTLRSAGLAAAGAARAAAAKYREVGFLVPDDGEVLITALLKIETRCKQLMGLID